MVTNNESPYIRHQLINLSQNLWDKIYSNKNKNMTLHPPYEVESKYARRYDKKIDNPNFSN